MDLLSRLSAFAFGGTGVRLPLYLGRGPGGMGGCSNPQPRCGAGKRSHSVAFLLKTFGARGLQHFAWITGRSD